MPKIVSVLDEKRLSDALNALLRPKIRSDFPEEHIRRHFLEKHPLGLPIPPHPFVGSRTVQLLGDTGSTDASVDAMSAVVLSRMRHLHLDKRGNYLRICKCEEGPGYAHSTQAANGWTKYAYFFEFGWGPSIFLASGCNNYSGQGGRGGRDLLAVFDLASDLFGLPIKEAVISEQDWERYDRALSDELYRQFQESKNR
jgi:hypothetical protein